MKRILLVSIGLLAACSKGGGTGSAPNASGSPLRNLGVSAVDVVGSGRLRIAAVDEGENGDADLNGDGDSEDVVLFSYDLDRGSLLNLGLAASQLPLPRCSFCREPRGVEGFPEAFAPHAHPERSEALAAPPDVVPPPQPLVQGQRAVFVVDEHRQGSQDLNGDTDTLDAVLFSYDARTGKTESLGLAVAAYGTSGVALGGDLVALAVSEFANGQQDLDGDGDWDDLVLHLHDLSTGVTVNTGLPLGSAQFLFADGKLAFYVREDAQTGDLNGDGDLADVSVLHLIDVASGVRTNTGLAAIGGVPLVASGTWTFLVAEVSQAHADLNGDGDALDFVYHTFDPSTGVAENLGVAAYSSYASRAERGMLGLSIDERSQGADLNGDLDTFDSVPLVVDTTVGLAKNTEIATGIQPAQVFVGDVLAISVSEHSQGDTDLNGDGDALDSVVHFFDPATGTSLNLGIAAHYLLGGDRWLLVQRDEVEVGQDLNGDQDQDDYVFFVWDAQRPGLRPMTRSNVGFGDLVDHVAIVYVAEFFENEDLNDDQDQTDVLIAAVDLVTNEIDLLPLAPVLVRQVSARRALVLVNEAGTDEDLNGDGDRLDRVFFDVVLFADPPGE